MTKIPLCIEGFAIVSEDGMIANAAGVMPDELKLDADQRFFERGLDEVDLVVHGRHSHEQQRSSDLRPRLILSRRIRSVASDPSNKKAMFWNPAGASLEQALTVLDVSGRKIGVIGGTNVFAIFLDSYDVFHLSRVPNVRLPGGRPVFPQIPERTPEEILASHGLKPGQKKCLDPEKGLTLVNWQRESKRN